MKLRLASVAALLAALGSTSANAGPKNFTLWTSIDYLEKIDLGTDGPGVADLWVGTGKLSAVPGGAVVGSSVFRSEVVVQNKQTELRETVIQYEWANGNDSILTGAIIEAPSSTDGSDGARGQIYTHAITGGTGRFSGARGTVVVDNSSGKNAFHLK